VFKKLSPECLFNTLPLWRNSVFSFYRRPSSPVMFRFSRRANWQVPYRHFRPATDILYSSAMNYQEAIMCDYLECETGVPRDTLAAVRHLVVDWPLWMSPGEWLPQLVFRDCPNLGKVSVVFPSSRRTIWGCFRAPAKRCKLRHADGAEKLLAEKAGEMVSMQ